MDIPVWVQIASIPVLGVIILIVCAWQNIADWTVDKIKGVMGRNPEEK